MNVNVKSELLRWARERSGIGAEVLIKKFPKFFDWEEGLATPTLKQLEKIAKSLHVPIGYLFLSNPPLEPLPIPDFRTILSKTVIQPSPNLLDVIYNCQERQGWYREFAQMTRQPTLPFVGSASINSSPEVVAKEMRATIGFDVESRSDCSTWADALRLFIKQIDSVGVLVMVSGVVLSNNRRQLDVQEFRGFALSDKLAPLIFINGSDSKAGQMFTIAHELAHLWLDSSALSNASVSPSSASKKEEVWCNQVAAEFLVPLNSIQNQIIKDEPLPDTLQRLARYFKVSTLVILRRLLDVGVLESSDFERAWHSECRRIKDMASNNGGGNFYRTILSRVGRRFAQALVISTLEGQTLYRDAFRMLGVSKTATFENLGREIGVML